MSENPKLTVLFEKLRGKTFELDKDQMSVGRRDGMDICIKDSSLSGHHADIIRTMRDGKPVFTLRDNDSTNGTRINNVPVTEQELKNSDLILFGGVEVLFDSDEEVDNSNFKTHTIDISSIDSATSTVPTLSNLNPFAGRDEKKHALVQKLMIAIVVIVALALVALAVYVVINMLSLDSEGGKGAATVLGAPLRVLGAVLAGA